MTWKFPPSCMLDVHIRTGEERAKSSSVGIARESHEPVLPPYFHYGVLLSARNGRLHLPPLSGGPQRGGKPDGGHRQDKRPAPQGDSPLQRDLPFRLPGGPSDAALAQVRESHKDFSGLGETGEFTIGKREGDSIVYLLVDRHPGKGLPEPIPFDSEFGEPMRRALSGLAGTVIGPDYHGDTSWRPMSRSRSWASGSSRK